MVVDKFVTGLQISNLMGTPVIVAGTVGGVLVGIHGTVDIQSDVTIGTVNIAGTLVTNPVSGSIGILGGTLGGIAGQPISVQGTLQAVSTVQSGSVGILGQPVSVQGTIDVRATAGTHAFQTYAGGTTGASVWIPASGKRINVTDLILSSNDGGTVTVIASGKGNTAGTFGQFYFAALGGLSKQLITPFVGSVDGALQITTTGGTVSISAGGFET